MSANVGIIVPVYNAEKYLVDALEGIRRQTYQALEIWLVFDACVDSSVQLAKDYASTHRELTIHMLFNDANQGAAFTRNRALQEMNCRYVAYLDTDDIWRENKLEKQLDFMHERQAGFSFTSYEFADEKGHGLGRVVHVPERMDYRAALKNTTIFTSTVMFDTQRIPKDTLYMPMMKSEDTALWWKVLRSGQHAYGLDENLTWYRRPKKSLSSNKIEALRRIWMLYRKAERLPRLQSAYYFCFWAIHAAWRRVG
ncbi:MAG: glycosyltransferase family 2 protein [Lachnospiraceae bacterium]|jgi:teichuronic acid biosynthesis glycosyltransferase TuaG|nr:glycosyltransferase family 2 protein [Lachnospiraceae bacterium]